MEVASYLRKRTAWPFQCLRWRDQYVRCNI